MNAAEAALLQEFIEEARLRGRRSKTPEEQQAAQSIERRLRRLIVEIETDDPTEEIGHALH